MKKEDQKTAEKDQKTNEPEQKKGNAGFLAGFIVCLLLAFLFVCCGNLFQNKHTVAQGTVSPETNTTEASRELSVTDLLKAVMTVMDDLESAVDDIKAGDPESAQIALIGVGEKTETIRISLDATIEALDDKMPSLQNQLANIQKILDLVDQTSDKLLMPMIGQLQEHPLSAMRDGDGINTRIICSYLDFVEKLMPDIEMLAAQASETDLSLIDSEGKIEKYLEDLNILLGLYHEDKMVFSRLKSVLGADGDRVYVVAAQNSAEVRASGGFPGAVGVVRIKDGILALDDFKKVYDVFSPNTPAQANITTQESYLFNAGLSAPRDADFCPDFERVAEIFALGYEARMGEQVNGVISMTPVVVQRILDAMNEEIILFDGTVLTGDNALTGLQHDLYFRYFGKNYTRANATTADQLFADAAKKTTQKVMEHLSFDDLSAYLDVIKESFADRTMMLWSKDTAEQALIEKMGWSGGLNKDPQKPQAGVYFSNTGASKMGLFLAVDTQIGERVRNEDGSYTYPVTVTLTNTMTKEELDAASAYITGGRGGGFGGIAYFFAPAGGTVSEFCADNGINIQLDEYHGLQLGYMPAFLIYPGKPLTISYFVTTAPGVETELTISRTPTLVESN